MLVTLSGIIIDVRLSQQLNALNPMVVKLLGNAIEVRLLQYLRGEIKFGSIEELSEQIRKDAEKSKEIFEKRGENGDV